MVRLSGRVRDNTVIRARSLEVKLSPEKGMMQVIFGECALDVGDMPSKDEALEAAMAPAEAAAAMEAPAAEPEMTAPMMEASPERVVDAQEMMTPSADASPAPISAAVPPVAMEPPAVMSPERAERKNGGKGRGAPVRSSTMPPPAH
ncbi:MAG: hypothetical protein H5U40_14430 [Polyangiaceae bacterium]|nr:hypothetical protein [Polyangiaceae bacterium]